ncbi:O-methyltransferase [Corynebacterium breve]|uniref:O-methyltransferase n=1 Tax=Corynebacterium breve TaxID=3049799 RepID=A0ABY8VHY2_9CORY|nr:O-methyltransferase [Corynebacterium breve]WIM68571.1 O-methyltransferase [Corynebacterium breve]
MSDTAYKAIEEYIVSSTEEAEAIVAARADADEFRLNVPDDMTGRFLSGLAATTSHPDSGGAIAITPAAGLVGLYLLNGLPGKTTVTCIDPEAEHQTRAKAAFRDAGFAPSRGRFLTSNPVDVIHRLAPSSYQLVYADVAPMDLPTIISQAFPLLTPGGALVIADALLDGTLADQTRKDRDTEAAREADALVDTLDDALVVRLPLGAGLTMVVRKA